MNKILEMMEQELNKLHAELKVLDEKSDLKSFNEEIVNLVQKCRVGAQISQLNGLIDKIKEL